MRSARDAGAGAQRGVRPVGESSPHTKPEAWGSPRMLVRADSWAPPAPTPTAPWAGP